MCYPSPVEFKGHWPSCPIFYSNMCSFVLYLWTRPEYVSTSCCCILSKPESINKVWYMCSFTDVDHWSFSAKCCWPYFYCKHILQGLHYIRRSKKRIVDSSFGLESTVYCIMSYEHIFQNMILDMPIIDPLYWIPIQYNCNPKVNTPCFIFFRNDLNKWIGAWLFLLGLTLRSCHLCF